MRSIQYQLPSGMICEWHVSLPGSLVVNGKQNTDYSVVSRGAVGARGTVHYPKCAGCPVSSSSQSLYEGTSNDSRMGLSQGNWCLGKSSGKPFPVIWVHVW